MSCEQVLISGYIPSEKTIISEISAKSIAECSDECCISGECDIFSYNSDTKKCLLHRFPYQWIYLPFPNYKNMTPTSDNIITGVLMKKKIATWLPWIAIIIIILVFWCYIRGHSGCVP